MKRALPCNVRPFKRFVKVDAVFVWCYISAMEKPTVVIAEDERDMRWILSERLEQEDIEVLGAGDGEEALRLLRENKVDLLLLDILMPAISGSEVLKKMSEDENLKKVPVIVLTNSVPDAAKNIEGTNVIDYIVKSDTPLDQIIKVVKEQLSKTE